MSGWFFPREASQDDWTHLRSLGTVVELSRIMFFGSHPTLGGSARGGRITATYMDHHSFCLQKNRASTWGTAGLDFVLDAMLLMCFRSGCFAKSSVYVGHGWF